MEKRLGKENNVRNNAWTVEGVRNKRLMKSVYQKSKFAWNRKHWVVPILKKGEITVLIF